MADTPADNLEHWGTNEVITSSKLNKMVDALLYAAGMADNAINEANSSTETARNAQNDVNSIRTTANQANTKADTSNTTANDALTKATNAEATANNALSQINKATGGKEYAPLAGNNTFTGNNTFSSTLTVGDLRVNGTIEGKLRTKPLSLNGTQVANQIDSADGIWSVGGVTAGLPANMQSGLLFAKSDGTGSNSGLMVAINKAEPGVIYLSYVSGGNPTDWKKAGGQDFEMNIKVGNGLNLNNLTQTGLYDLEANNVVNTPAGVVNATMLVMQGSEKGNISNKYLTQTLVDQQTGTLYSRSCWNGEWTEWQQALTDNYLRLHNITGGSIGGDSGTSTTEINNPQDLNQLRRDGRYILTSNSNSNLPTDPDTNDYASGPFTCNVIANNSMTIATQELVQATKGYKYVRSFANNSWSSWSVLTPFS